MKTELEMTIEHRAKKQPCRIQRKRQKGWKMPPGSISVCRPGKWGNPFRLFGNQVFIDAGYRKNQPTRWALVCPGDAKTVVRLFESILTGFFSKEDIESGIDLHDDVIFHLNEKKKHDITELSGKDLACFCGPNQPCHADVLILHSNR